ncbi:hypothetical protein GWK47_047548 [Chionoecetes opilio]|uniref:Uncharacterized protein n=1 Tax=Chionoecetes opilio TaxID=41210 RepID=A0A8J4YB24_CHIOP|nr:hypothetical protein GWK47_047548 [Chionoecetes opilio]
MMRALQEQEGSDDPSRATVELTSPDLAKKTVASFVTSVTPSFFEILGLDAGLLAVDSTACPDNPGYTTAAACVKELRTVNDFAEWGVALVQDFNLVLTKNKEQRQFLLQVVEEQRRKYPTPESPQCL